MGVTGTRNVLQRTDKLVRRITKHLMFTVERSYLLFLLFILDSNESSLQPDKGRGQMVFSRYKLGMHACSVIEHVPFTCVITRSMV